MDSVTGGQLAVGDDPELPEDRQIIFDARFFDPDELDEYPVYPAMLVNLIREHLERGFPEGALYLGTHQPDLPR